MQTFALQRITTLRMLKSMFKRNSRFNEQDHLDRGFGVCNYGVKKKQAHEVSIHFEGYAARVFGEGL